MTEEVSVRIREAFYRDSFGKVILIMISFLVAIGLLVSVSVYLYLNKPKPVTFLISDEWRVQPAIPLDQPYLSDSDVLQWVNDAIRNAFIYDFYQYNDQLKKATQFFTPDGWKVFLNQLNIYVNYNNVQSYKMFVNAAPTGAPYILNKGLLSGRYAWWVQMPINITYVNGQPPNRALTLQILVVRVSTLNNLSGVGIDNVIVAKGAINQLTGTG